jgi:hypothetical protein
MVLRLFVIVLAMAWRVAPGTALAEVAVPERTLAAVRLLQSGKFEQTRPGLDVLHATGNEGLALTALRIDPMRLRLRVAEQRNPDGERVDAFGEREGAALAVNGGFFGEKEPGKGLFPVGYLRLSGKVKSSNWAKSGGYLILGENGIAIAPSAETPPEGRFDVLQSKPLIIAPGGVWAMNTNQEIWRPRSIVCVLPDRQVLLLVVSGLGMSLFEAGWLLRSPVEGGYFGCDSALALDGGGSTQLWVEGRDDLAVNGETAVHNALAVVAR